MGCCCNNITCADMNTLIITLVSILASANLSIEDKLKYGRILIYIGQVLVLNSAFEAEEVAKELADKDKQSTQEQLDELTKQLDELKKQLK